MKRETYIKIVSVVCACIAIASCSTQQAIQKHYTTLQEHAQVTLKLDQHQYNMGCTIRNWKNELVIISLQPLAGVEMFRMEATQDSLWVFDKMNRRYTVLAFPTLAGMIDPSPSLKLIQEYVNGNATKNADHIEKSFTYGQHTLIIGCTITQREYNNLGEHSQLPTARYRRVSLKEIIPL